MFPKLTIKSTIYIYSLAKVLRLRNDCDVNKAGIVIIACTKKCVKIHTLTINNSQWNLLLLEKLLRVVDSRTRNHKAAQLNAVFNVYTKYMVRELPILFHQSDRCANTSENGIEFTVNSTRNRSRHFFQFYMLILLRTHYLRCLIFLKKV